MKAVIFIHVLYLILIKTFMVKGVSKCDSKVELRAVLLSCPAKDTGCEDDDLLSQAIKSEEFQLLQADSENFEALKEEKEKGFSNAVKDCKRKLVITLKIRNSGRSNKVKLRLWSVFPFLLLAKRRTRVLALMFRELQQFLSPNEMKTLRQSSVNSRKIPCDEEYIVVDHVFDPVTGGRGRLLSPVVLKLRQEQMTHLYGLQFQRVVNSDPYEEQKASGQTCSVNPKNPTCGIAMYDGKPIPFSEGFCCSCNSHSNAKRQSLPTTRKDSPLYSDYKMTYQGSPHFVSDGKVPIVDPTLIKLNSERTAADGTDDPNDMCDPLSWDKIPNYLLEHDRKVICDRGDFMNELCKLQEGKRLAARSSCGKGQSKKVGTGKNKKVAGTRTGVKVEGPDLKNGIAVNVDAAEENFLKDVQQRNVTLLKNFIKTLNVDQSTGSDNYGSVKSSRGKRENRNENKKLSLEEKLERFVNSKSHLANPRKRLLELSHKRRRTVDDRSASEQECRPVNMPLYLQKSYSKCTPPKYFFSHDKFIIDPVETAEVAENSSCKVSNSVPFEEAKDETYELRARNMEKHAEGEVTQEFNRIRLKNEGNKEKIILEKVKSDRSKVSHNEGGETEDSFDAGERRTHNYEQLLKMPYFHGRDSERYSPQETAEESEAKIEGSYIPQAANKPGPSRNEEQQKEEKTGRLSCKCLKNLFRKSESHEKCVKPQKIRNFFMAKSREREQLKPEYGKFHKKFEEDPRKSDFFRCKNSKEEIQDNAKAREGKLTKEEEKEDKNMVAPQEKERKILDETQVKSVNSQSNQWSQFSQVPPNKEAKVQQLRKENEILRKENFISKGKEEEKAHEEKAHGKQQLEKMPQTIRRDPSKDFMSDSDFSFEIIRQKFPEFSYPQHEETLRKSSSKVQMNPLDMELDNLMKKYNNLKNKKNFRLHHKLPWKYHTYENDAFPSHLNALQTEKNTFRENKNRYGYPKEQEPEPEPESEVYGPERLDRRLNAEYKNYLQKKPFVYPRFPKYDDQLVGYENKLNGLQVRGERLPVHRRLDNGYRQEAFQVNLRLRPEKIRSKRSSSYSSQPGGKSEFEAGSPERETVNELESCLPAQSEKARKSEKVTTSRAGRQTGRQSTRFKRGNVSSDESGISNSQPPQSGQSEVDGPVDSLRQKTIKAAFDKQRLIQSYLNAPDYVLEEVEAAIKEKRQTSKFNYTRGNVRVEGGEQETQETAHCMRFGDMWYSLYTINKPMVSQTVGIQLFDKHLLWDGTSQWRDLTKGKMIRVGTYLTKAEDELPSISVTFMGGNPEKVQSAIDPENYYLLIPSHVSSPSKMSFYPQFEGGPKEYLVVHSKDVSSGGECNMVGTSFEAFARQPDRCNQPKGSCLKRQPVDLWREDMEARIRGKRGKYFVENFGTVSNSSVKTYTNLSGDFLALEYYGEYTSTIEIEVKADSNAVVRKGSIAQIPLVYVDSTYPKKTRIILSVLNTGLTSSFFRPRLGDCPPDLDPAWCPLEGPLVTIPPQQRHDFKLDLSGVLPSRQILVSVQVLNPINKVIASRRIDIRRGDRCVCAFHCKCNCIGDSGDDRTCRRLSLKDYRKAGYITSFPFRAGTVTSTPETILKNIHIVFLTASYVLLLLGVIKGILGIFVRRIGIAGIKIITGPRELCRYYESELQSCSVLFDECGFPVHPTTCQPVQIVPLWLETIMNVFFFFLYPLRGLWFLILSLACCKALCCECENCAQNYAGETDRKCSRPLLSKGLSPTCVHYNLTTINSKKSKQDEFLPYPAYKGDDDPLEEDDTEFVLQEMKRYRKE